MEQIAPISILRTHTATSMFSSIVEFELGLYFIYFYPLTKFASAHPFCSFQSSLFFLFASKEFYTAERSTVFPRKTKGNKTMHYFPIVVFTLSS